MYKRVVIADDAAFFRTALRDILSKGGFEVIGEAVNGAEALEKVQALRPDIVILDVVMPVKNGLEAAKEISLLKLPLKIVMCTSLGYEPIVEEAMKSGACAYIIKPLSEAKVLDTLNGLGGAHGL
ncbi:MAG: response regulator [Deltaproteobacteria bacterium]|nr:response regulator [Deltaproteobacteria bacterium]